MKAIFGKVVQIWVINGQIYFECDPYQTMRFKNDFEAYMVEEVLQAASHHICTYGSPPDF